VAIVNKPGAAGALGYREIAHSKPDGYTLGTMQYPDSAVLVAHKGKEAGFTYEDLVPIGSFTRTPDVFATREGAPFKTFQEFVAYAKQNPGKVTVSVPGEAHILAVVLMEQFYGVKVKTVLFKSGGEAYNTLLGGHVMTGMFLSSFAIGAKEKGIIPFALTGSQKMEKLADVPFFKDLGQDVPVDLMTVFCMPQGTPEPIAKKLASTFAELGKDAEFVEKVKGSGVGYDALLGGAMEKYYKEMNKTIAGIVEQNKDRFAQ